MDFDKKISTNDNSKYRWASWFGNDIRTEGIPSSCQYTSRTVLHY